MKQVIRQAIKEANNVNDEKPFYTLLLDMNSIMKMSLIDKRLNSKGEEYGMIFQTLLQIKIQLQRRDFTFCYAMYDGEQSGQLRYNYYQEYKANRDKNYELHSGKSEYDKKIEAYCRKVLDYSRKKKQEQNKEEDDDENFQRQREVIFECLEELFCRNCIFDEVEGDDLIAYYVMHKKPNEKILIVSGDRDLTQLISDDVSIYVTQLKKEITPQNHVKEIGFTHENVLIKKILCGDASDNIKGIKGMGERTFFNLFPSAVTEKITLDEVLEKTQELIDERVKNKKKPLAVTENLINRVTTGSQGKDIFEINDKIINLKHPLLTKEAETELNDLMYAPLDPEGRDFKNLYNIVVKNGMTDFLDENHFSNFFSSFNGLIDKEKKFFNSAE